MQNVMQIATNAGHTAQNDGRTAQNDGRTTQNDSRTAQNDGCNTLNVCQGPKGGLSLYCGSLNVINFDRTKTRQNILLLIFSSTFRSFPSL